MTQLDSIPQQIIYFYEENNAEETYFRGVGDINGVRSTIVLALTDFASNSGGLLDGSVVFSGEIRNPVELQRFNGDITRSDSGFVNLEDGQPGTLVRLDFNDSEIALTVNPFREPAPTFTFQYEPTTQEYALGHLSLAPGFDAAQYGASNPDLSSRTDLDLNDFTEHFLFGEISEEFPDGTPPDNTPPDDTSPIENTRDLFRFRNTAFETGTYVFVGEAEKDAILADENLSNTFSLDGRQEDGTVNAAFTASKTSGDNLIAFYRLKSLDVEGTFLFVAKGEYDGIFEENSEQKDKWEKEGFNTDEEDIPEFYLYDGSSDLGTEFNRFQNNQNGTFLYAGEAEASVIESDSNLSNLFTNQGVAFKSL